MVGAGRARVVAACVRVASHCAGSLGRFSRGPTNLEESDVPAEKKPIGAHPNGSESCTARSIMLHVEALASLGSTAMGKKTDAELIREGDTDAWNRLEPQGRAKLKASLHRYFHDRDVVDDAYQQACLKAWDGRGTFRGDAEFSTWLHTIGHRCAVEILRGRRNHVSLDKIDVVAPPEAMALGPDALAELSEAVNKCLDKVENPKYRRILTLRLQGRKYKDIAQTLEIEFDDAKGSGPHTALKKLRRCVKSKIGGPES